MIPVSLMERLRLTAVFAALALLLATACRRDLERLPPIVNEKTKTPESAEGYKSVTQESDTWTLKFTFEPGASPPAYASGDVIVGTGTGQGYLRKVVSISQSGDTLTVRTEPATLTDAFDQLDLDTTFHLMPQAQVLEGMRQGPVPVTRDGETYYMSVQSDRIVITPLGEFEFRVLIPGISITLEDTLNHRPAFTFQWDSVVATKSIAYDWRLRITPWLSLESLRFVVNNTERFQVFGAEAQLEASIPLLDTAIPFPPKPISLGTVTIPILMIPVVFTFDLQFYVGAEAGLTVTTSERLGEEVDVTTSTTCGAEWDRENDEWIWISERNISGQFEPELPEIALSLSAEAYVKAEVGSKLYDVVGPTLGAKLGPYAELSLNSPDWLDYELGVAMGVDIGLEVQIPIIGYNLAKIEHELFDYRLTMLNPPEYPEPPSGPESGTVSQTYSFTASTTDADGDKIAYQFDWGDSQSEWTSYVTSGTPITTSHSWPVPGYYPVRVRAKDDHLGGVLSAKTDWSQPHDFRIGEPTPVFAEDFNSYPVGPGIGAPWADSVISPSELRIVSSGHTGNALEVSDPTTDTAPPYDSSYAWARTTVSQSYEEVEFKFYLNGSNCDMQVRAWGDLGNLGSRSWDLDFIAGDLCYVDNQEVPRPVAGIVPLRWYTVKLSVNWQAKTYDIYLDGGLTKSAAPFRGSSPGGSIIDIIDVYDSWTPTDGFRIDDLVMRTYNGGQTREGISSSVEGCGRQTAGR